MKDIDPSALRDLAKGPGIDTRTWVSYGRVDVPGAEQGSQVVEFDVEDGQLYVNITLLPDNIPARARLGMLFAGPGEAFYSPFVGNEEVLVVIPEGNVRAGCVIVARLNNAYDAFPFQSVAGADPTQNSFGVIRTKNAITIESGASIMLRSAEFGAFVRIDGRGNVTLRDADANVLQLSPDVFGYQNGAGDVVQQLDLNDKRHTLQIGQAALVLAGDAGGQFPQSYVQAPSTLTLAAGGLSMNNAVEHLVTTEQLVHILSTALPLVLAAAVPPVAWVPPPPNPASPFYAALAAGLAAAATTPANPALAAALFTIFTAPVAKPPATPGFGQLQPGIGCQGLLGGLVSAHGYPAPARRPQPRAARHRFSRRVVPAQPERGGHLRLQDSAQLRLQPEPQHPVPELPAAPAVQLQPQPEVRPKRPARRGSVVRWG